MKKFGLILATIAMISFGSQAHAQVGRAATQSAETASASGWAWTVGIIGTALIIATGTVVGVVSSSNQSTFNH